MSAGAEFHENIANTWSEGYQSGSFRKRLDLFRGLIQSYVSADSSWLDLGCGSGVLTHEILKCNPRYVIGVDGSPSMLNHAQVATAQSPHAYRVDWRLGDVSALPFVESGSLDGVLCSSVIEYMVDPSACLREARRTLRDGGTLILSVPVRTSPVRRAQKWARSLGRIINKDLFPYLDVSKFEISRTGATEFLSRYKFRLVSEISFDPHIPRALLSFASPALLVMTALAE
jgi:ubiquinone/menaquinone biosynthesis C-methylase UbiE